MEFAMVIIAAVLADGLFALAFYAGYQLGSKKEKEEEGLKVTKENKDAVANLCKWIGYSGKRGINESKDNTV